jgi:hypothetical protein
MPSRSLSDEEHYKFMTDLLVLIANANVAVGNAVVKVFPEFARSLERENKIINMISKKHLSDNIHKAEKMRAGLYDAIRTVATTYLSSFVVEEVFMAEKLGIIFDDFGDFSKTMPEEKTTKIDGLLNELENCADICSQLHLSNFIKDLTVANNMYAIFSRRYRNVRATMQLIEAGKKIRARVDILYTKMTALIEMAMLMNGISKYSDFVLKLNMYILAVRRKTRENITAPAKSRNSAQPKLPPQ